MFEALHPKALTDITCIKSYMFSTLAIDRSILNTVLTSNCNVLCC